MPIDSEGPSPITGLYPWMLLLGLFAVLGVVVFVDSVAEPDNPWSIPTLLLFTVVLGVGATDRSRLAEQARRHTIIWLATLSVIWTALVWMQPAAAYLVFPLYILLVWLLPLKTALPWVVLLALVSIASVVSDLGWTLAGFIGPVIGFAVAVGIAIGCRVILTETARRGLVIQELRETQDRLAASERESGRLAERARLAREIHDTTAQGLTSIQMLLHAAESADPEGPGIEQIRLARETAAVELAETRRVINALAPSALDRSNLEVALDRLASTTTSTGTVRVTAWTKGTPRPLPCRLGSGVADLPGSHRQCRAACTCDVGANQLRVPSWKNPT